MQKPQSQRKDFNMAEIPIRHIYTVYIYIYIKKNLFLTVFETAYTHSF